MKKYLFLILSFIFLLETVSNGSQATENTKQKYAIAELYMKIQGFKSEGIPQKNEIDSISPFLSAQFIRLLLIASEKEKQRRQSSNEIVPPLVEGNLFCSLFEGYTSVCKIWQDSTDKNRFYVKLAFKDTDKKFGKDILKENNQIVWIDRVILKNENDHWVVDDIELMGNWDFGLKGSVKKILIDVGGTH